MKITKNIGMLLLSIWLIVSGLIVLVPSIAFSGSGTALAVLAVATGIMLLLGK